MHVGVAIPRQVERELYRKGTEQVRRRKLVCGIPPYSLLQVPALVSLDDEL